jgi:hypothetical protein
VAASPKHGTAHRYPSWNGGGAGGVHRGVTQARHSTSPTHPPTPTHVRGKIKVVQARHCTSPIPPEEPTNRGMGGGETGGVHRGVDQERHCKSPIPPPSEKPTIRVMGGGGTRGVQCGVAQARKCTAPSPPSCPGKSKLKMRLTYLVVYQKRQTTH